MFCVTLALTVFLSHCYVSVLEICCTNFNRFYCCFSGQSRMAFVQRVNDEGPGDPFYETLGMITFEDVIADIFQSGVTAEAPEVISQ